MINNNIKIHVEKFINLIPDHGITIAKAAFMYFVQMKLDEEFINEVSKLMEPSSEKELKEYVYEWNITKKDNGIE